MIPVLDSILGRFSNDLGIDLGTVNTLIVVKGKGIAIREPSIVAAHKKSKKIVAFGVEAKKMLGRTPVNIEVVRPLRGGVISDYDTTLAMLSNFIDKIHDSWGKSLGVFSRPRVVIGVPSFVSEVERRALADVAAACGAREVLLVDEPIAAAIGAGINIMEAAGTMIVDIGGGTSEIAIISLGGIVVGKSLKVGGDAMDEDIIRYVRMRYSLSVGEATAEEIKLNLASAYPVKVEKEMIVRGRDLEKGLPKAVKINSVQVREALSATITSIIAAIRDVIHDAPPELANDISTRGIVLSGGGALISGMGKLISSETKLPVTIAEEPLSCVARGCAYLLEDSGLFSRLRVARGK